MPPCLAVSKCCIGGNISRKVYIYITVQSQDIGSRPIARLLTFLFTFAIAQFCASETQSKTFASSTAL